MKVFVAASFWLSSVFAFSPRFSAPRAFVAPKMSESKTQLKGEYGASSTSFYTTVEKKDTYESLDAVLDQKCSDPKVRQVIKDMLDVCAEITEALRTALVTVEGSMNDFGDAQLSVDVRSNHFPGRLVS
jgi:sedoheptulose-bisphosphatase